MGPARERSRQRVGEPGTPGPSPEHELPVSFMTAARGGTERLRVVEDGRTRTLEVAIPPGVSDGTRLRVGDLMLRLRVGHHPLWRRSELPGGPEQGLDLYLDLPLTLAEATLGATVAVPTLDGVVELTVPPGTSSGRKLRLRGRGLTDASGRRGDLYAIVRVVVPDGRTLSAEESAALRRVAERGPHPRAGSEWRSPAA